ncbi:MAG TPA: ISL3 family transposase [Rhabdochlamydiaceae bacterium]|nr:ISL3 family transposase [Rhabdochlamydiaceae bacterium]
MEAHHYLIQGLLLPELKLVSVSGFSRSSRTLVTVKERKGAVCPKCARLSLVLYDRRKVRLKDQPIQGKMIFLEVWKHRYFCKPCKRPFTEPLPGVLPRRQTTQRFRAQVYWACENFTDLKRVCRAYRVSPGFVHHAFYEQLALRSRKHHRYPFTESIGIDEHCFGRKKGLGKREFVTMVVDHKNKKLFDVTLGKSHAELWAQLESREGRENVKKVTLDLSDSYKSFVKGFFPNAQIIADRFHVQRLFNPILHQARMEATGDQRKNPARILLNKNRSNLKHWERSVLDRWLLVNPKINEIYQLKEAVARMYHIRGVERAEQVFDRIIAALDTTQNKLLKTLQATFKRWKQEILNFFRFRLTNARVEGFNNVAKVIKRRAYGFRSFENYKLRLLNACS